jgi:hypothetical protein
MSIAMTGDDDAALGEDLEAAVRELMAPMERDPSLWTRGFRGKWTAGQHAAHVAIVLSATAATLEQNARRLAEGTLRRPRRGVLQRLFLRLVIARGRLPRGAKTPRAMEPDGAPSPVDVRDRLAREVARHRAVGARLPVEDRDRLWVPNPFLGRWHYRYPELLRMHAVHARHHAALVREIAEADPEATRGG